MNLRSIRPETRHFSSRAVGRGGCTTESRRHGAGRKSINMEPEALAPGGRGGGRCCRACPSRTDARGLRMECCASPRTDLEFAPLFRTLAQFGICTLFWLTTCVAFAAWLLTLPPWLTFEYQGGVEWLKEFDFAVRIISSAIVFASPYAMSWSSRYWDENEEWLRDRIWIVVCGMLAVLILCLAVTEL